MPIGVKIFATRRRFGIKYHPALRLLILDFRKYSVVRPKRFAWVFWPGYTLHLMQLELRMNHRDSRPHEARRMPFAAWLPSVRETAGLATAFAFMIGALLIKVIPAMILTARH